MKTKILEEPIDKMVEYGGLNMVLSELDGNTKAGNIARGGFYHPYRFVKGDTFHNVPMIQISDLEAFLEGEMARDPGQVKYLHSQENSKRRLVVLYHGVVIKSARSDISHPSIHSDQDKAAFEFVMSHSAAAEVRRHVVKNVSTIESVTMKHGVRKVTAHIMERYFDPLVDPNQSDEKARAYARFLENIHALGLRYCPVDSSRPYADLVVRKKKNGSLKVMATSLPKFEKEGK